ncbi:MAG: hypothetical protein JJE15_08065, partial [Desulfobacteraceae bacterium]|nr:hypothetical protein [Desulfobacteraceae bacterium]
ASSVGDNFYVLDDGIVVHSGVMENLVHDEELKSNYLGISKAVDQGQQINPKMGQQAEDHQEKF